MLCRNPGSAGLESFNRPHHALFKTIDTGQTISLHAKKKKYAISKNELPSCVFQKKSAMITAKVDIRLISCCLVICICDLSWTPTNSTTDPN
jgi:hypothetical protein